MAELIPETGTEIISTTEDVGSSEVITSTLATVESWSVEFVGAGAAPDNPPSLVGTDQGDSFLIEYVPTNQLFPLQYVDYLEPDQTRVRVTGVDAWDQVPGPEDAPEIVEMREDDKDLLEWSAEVTATGLDGEGQPVSATADYTITVFANYNLSRDILVEAVNARR